MPALPRRRAPTFCHRSSAPRGGGRKRSAIRCCSKRPPAAAARACASSSEPQTSSARSRARPPKPRPSFKDGRVYLEKLISNPRHIEVQVLGDDAGNVVHLGERDCSVQKPSHQKLIEEAPAPQPFRRGARSRCTAWRFGACQHVRYTNAGTLEFLVERRRRLFHGDEHAHPGRAPGHARWSTASISSKSRSGSRPAKPLGFTSARPRRTRPRDRVPDQRGGSAQ